MSPHAEGEDILALQTVLYTLTSAVAEEATYFCAVRAVVSSQLYCDNQDVAFRYHAELVIRSLPDNNGYSYPVLGV